MSSELSWPSVVRRQMILLFGSGRVWILAGMCGVALLATELILRPENAASIRRVPLWRRDPALEMFLYWLILIVPIWAVTVWHTEGPRQRSYHWSMPVGRAPHDIARVVAGALWLVIVIAAVVPVGILLAWTGDTPRLVEYGPLFWINLFTFPLLVYALASVIPMTIRRPGRFAIIVSSFFIAYFIWALSLPRRTLSGLYDMNYGLITATFGGINLSRVNAIEAMGGTFRRAVPDQAEFLIANALWFSLAILTIALVARRKPA